MSEPFIGEIQMFPYDYAPARWARCDGQMMPLMQNTALYSLLGTLYGGDGRTTFALPDLRGRFPVAQGSGGETPKIGEARVLQSAEASSNVDERSFGALGVPFCIALEGIYPRRS